MVISAIHSGSHEIRHTGIHPDIVPINVLMVDGLGNEEPMRPCNHPTIFHQHLHGVQTGRLDHFLIKLMNRLPHMLQIHRLLAGLVGNSNSAAEIDEINFDIKLLEKLDRDFKKHPGCLNEKVGIQLVRGDHGV